VYHGAGGAVEGLEEVGEYGCVREGYGG
jgi:hypothetical protein